jgi:hypothetical protein
VTARLGSAFRSPAMSRSSASLAGGEPPIISRTAHIRRVTGRFPGQASNLAREHPLVEAIGNTLAEFAKFDSQEQARRVVTTVIDVLQAHLAE